MSRFFSVIVLLSAVPWFASPAVGHAEPLAEPDVSADPTGEPAAESDPHGPTPAPAPAGDQPTSVINFDEEEGFGMGEVMTSQDPTPLKHETLLPKRYRGPDPNVSASHEPAAGPTRLRIGVRAGLAVAGFGNAPDSSTRLGAVAGLFANYRIAERVAIQPELHLAQKGSLADASGATTRLNYVAAGVLAQAVLVAGPAELHAGAGPSLGLSLTSAVGDVELERLDLGAVVNLGARLAGSAIALDARYEHGLTSVVGPGFDGGNSVTNRAVSVTLGYLF